MQRAFWPSAVVFALALCVACGLEGDSGPSAGAGSEVRTLLAVSVADDAQLRVGLGRGDGRVEVEVLRVLDADASEAIDVAATGDVLCLRALDASGWPFLQAGVVSACGETYFTAQSGRQANALVDAAALSRRNDNVAALLQQMQDRRAPPQATVLWQHAIAHLDSFLTPFGVTARRSADLEARRPHLPGVLRQAAAGPSLGAGPPATVHPYLGPLDPLLARRGSPHERLEHPALEFRQRVELYSKKVRAYLLVGALTDIDHSATHITVLSRRRGSSEAWQPFAETWTRNHGTPAADPAMEHYATCDELPVTAGYFAWKGECPGKWGEAHLCNDDSRYQLWHAYGGWSEVPFCAETFHGTRPTCRKPW